MTAEQQYLDLIRRILNEGVWVENARTGKKCLTVISHPLCYTRRDFPLITTRKCFWKAAIAEIIGYWRGLTDAQAFKDLGAPTWLANANENESWLKNSHRQGENDMGFVYGAVGQNFGGINQFVKVYEHLKAGIDDRGEIITYWKPDEFHRGCLRPCLHTMQFSSLGGKLYLDCWQRSCDVPLGVAFNMMQVHAMLLIMAQITGHEFGVANHTLVNAHIYEDQIPMMEKLVQRTPFDPPSIEMDSQITTWEDVQTVLTPHNFTVSGYKHHPKMEIPFSV